MDDHELETVRRLGELRDTSPSTAPSVDIERAIRTGRRRRRVRSVSAGTVVAAVTAVILVVAPTAADRLTHEPPSRPGVTRSEFDVRTRTFSVGSAGGFTPTAYQTGRTWQRVYLRDAHASDVTSGLDLATVTMYAKGQRPVPDGSPAPAVNGHRAVWPRTPTTGAGGTEIAWEWRAGAWAYAHVRGAGDERRTLAYRVALSTWPAEASTVRTPFTVARSALGASSRLTGTVSSVGVSQGPPMTTVLLGVPGGGWLAVGVQRQLASGTIPGLVGRDVKPTTTSGDHPAAYTATGVVLFDVTDGYHVVVEASDAATAARAGGRKRLAEIAASVRLAEDPTDQTTWPTDPFR